MIRYEIIIITYNQENTIEDALYSAIKQTLPPYKISIFDDCSTDNTYNIIQSFISNTNINIKLHRNKNNMGIFPNYNQAIDNATGDIVCFLAGDDELELNLLENYNIYIQNNDIDIRKPVWMIPNITEINSNGLQKKVNQYALSCYSIYELILSNKIRSFELGLTLPALKLSYIKTDIGYQADNLKSLLVCKQAETKLVNFYGYKYRISTGVTRKMSPDELYKTRIKSLSILLNKYERLLNKREKILTKYELVLIKNKQCSNIYTFLCQLLLAIRILLLKNIVQDKINLIKDLFPTGLKNKIKFLLRKSNNS